VSSSSGSSPTAVSPRRGGRSCALRTSSAIRRSPARHGVRRRPGPPTRRAAASPTT
jgi:hypothetical protein